MKKYNFWSPIFHPEQTQLIVLLLVAFLLYTFEANFEALKPVTCIILPAFITSFDLKKLSQNQNMYPWKKAKLYTANDDLSKRWYIEFYVFDVQKNQLVRKKDYSINKLTTVESRKAQAKKTIREINELLSEGYHIDINKQGQNEPIIKGKSLKESFDSILEIRKLSMKHNSYLSFSSVVKLFLGWAKEKNYDQLGIKQFNRFMAQEYVDSLLLAGKSGVTINKNCDFLKSLCNGLIERNIIETNPFIGVKKAKEVLTPKNLPYSDEEISILKKYITAIDPELWFFIQFLFYCFMRPNEIRQLKWNQIDFKYEKININSIQSKNNKSDWIDIPTHFIPVLKENIGNPNDFIFPGTIPNQPVGKNTMSRNHFEIIKKLKLNKDHTLYSWKPTGVIKAFRSGINIKAIQRQCRHSSLEMTDRYLKSLGLMDNPEMKAKMPKI